MALPSILRIRRRPAASVAKPAIEAKPPGDNAERKATTADIKRATRLRRAFAIVASSSYLLSFIFLILVVVGNTHNRAVLRDIYFFKLDLSNIIPTSVPNASLINSIAQSIGLHDFYQVGLWNFCEGYNNVGITACSAPVNLYWFNPVEILLSELLSGATIALPTQVIEILNILRIASQVMFGFFITGTVLNFVLIFLSPIALRSHWWSLPLAVTAFISTLMVLGGTIIASVISFVFKYAAESQSSLNISADVGIRMFVFIWLAAGFTLWSFIIHAGMGCCCTSRRDLKTGRKEMRNGTVQDK